MHIPGHLPSPLAAQTRTCAYPKRHVSHQGPLRRLYMGLSWRARRRGTMPGIRIAMVNDRGACAAPIRTATSYACDARKDRFIMDLKLAIPWGSDGTGSSTSTFLCSQGRQAHHFLNRRYQQIYVRRRILFRVMPARSVMLEGAVKPLACQPRQPRLEWSPAWVVED